MKRLTLGSLPLGQAGSTLSPFMAVASRAAAWYDSKTMGATTDQTIVNSANPAADPAIRGATTSIESTDPVFVLGAELNETYWDFDGSNDHIKFPASDTPTFTATTGKHTLVVKARRDSSGGAVNDGVYSTGVAGNDALLIYVAGDPPTGSITFRVDGTGADVNDTISITGTEIFVVAAVIDNGTLSAYSNTAGLKSSVSITGTGTINHLAPVMGARTNNTLNGQISGFSVLKFPGEALTEEELDVLSATLISGDYTL